MMREAFTRMLAWAIAVSVGLGWCANASGSEDRSNMSSSSDSAPSAKSVNEKNPATHAVNTFGVRLFKQLAKSAPGKNVFISPYSISAAMAMATEGARGDTEAELVNALAYPNNSGSARRVTTVHAGFMALRTRMDAAAGSADTALRSQIKKLEAQLEKANEQARQHVKQREYDAADDAQNRAHEIADKLNSLRTQVDRFELTSANALWVAKQFPLLDSYRDEINTYYETGGTTPMNFAEQPEQCRQQINQWVEDQTAARIKNLLAKGTVTPDTGLIITNAIYFLGQWADPFDKDRTTDADFTLADGNSISVRMMNDRYRDDVVYAAFNADGSFFDTPAEVPASGDHDIQTYPAAGGFTMIELLYKGDELAMTLIAPRSADGLAAIEGLLGEQGADAWLARLTEREVHVAVPRFRLESNYELKPALKQLGIARAFVNPALPDGADFSGMSTSSDPRKQLFIGQVVHKAWLDVNEEGTEAAAATAVIRFTGAAAPEREMVPFIPEFRADRPFVFMIRDRVSGTILFIGRIENPNG